MNKIKNHLLGLSILLSLPVLSFAQFNQWQSGFAQGVQEYGIADKNNVLLLSCDKSSGLGHHLTIMSRGDFNDLADFSKHPLTFYFNNGQAYTLKTKQNISAHEWQTFTLRLAGAQSIQVYHQNSKLLDVKPSIFSRKKYAQKLVNDCKAENLNYP